MDRALFEKIAATYRETGSIEKTAEACGTYPIKVRKVLITTGAWHSKRSDGVNALRERGYSVSEIAETLGMDEKNVWFYLPYTEEALDGEKGESGKRVQDYRERNRQAAEDAARRKATAGPGGIPEEYEGVVHERAEKRRKKNALRMKYDHEVWKNLGMLVAKEEEGVSNREAWKGYWLRIEAVAPAGEMADPDKEYEGIYEGVEDAEAMRALGRAKEGIRRDIVVPGEMSLRKLHYAIQRAFGFRNSGEHHFALPKGLLKRMTMDRTEFWAALCGMYLHAPVVGDREDLYWDDDYREGQSPKAWLRSKYTGTAEDYAVGETYIDTERLMAEERSLVLEQMGNWMGGIGTYETLSLELHQAYFGEETINRVLERLRVEQILRKDGMTREEAAAWWQGLWKKNEVAKGYLEACGETRAVKSLKAEMAALRALREDRGRLERGMRKDRKETAAEIGRRPEEEIEAIGREIAETEQRIGTAMHAFDPEAEPVTEELIYRYDERDRWMFRIRCMGIYTRWERNWEEEAPSEEIFGRARAKALRDPETERRLEESVMGRDFSEAYEYEDTDGRRAGEALREALMEAEMGEKPVCIGVDGMNLADGCGGIDGFFDLLRVIHGADKEEAARKREWARGQGWREVLPKAEGLL